MRAMSAEEWVPVGLVGRGMTTNYRDLKRFKMKGNGLSFVSDNKSKSES